jgi:hypothetical protein
MIENFSYINRDNISVKINLTDLKSETIFLKKEQNLFFEIYNSEELGLFWNYDKHQIVKFEDKTRIIGIPSPDLKYVVSIHAHNNSSSFDNIQNLIIYNTDGSLYKDVFAPSLISKFSAQYYQNFEFPHTISFSNIYWTKSNGKIDLTVKIGFAWNWYEERVLDVETGEFGECLGCGMF